MMQAKDAQLARQEQQIKFLTTQNDAQRAAMLKQTASLTARLEKLERVTEANRDAATMHPASSLQPPQPSSSTTF
jgi:hypothetical protein